MKPKAPLCSFTARRFCSSQLATSLVCCKAFSSSPHLSAWGARYMKQFCPAVDPLVGYLHHPSSSMDSASFAVLLERCTLENALVQGMVVHSHIIECNLGHITFVLNFLVQMYSKCEAIAEATALFVTMHYRNEFSWNLIIRAYARLKQGKRALMCFSRMQEEAVLPSKVTYVSALDACACEGMLSLAHHMHTRIAHTDFEEEVVWRTALVNMYAKCSNLKQAVAIFERMDSRNSYSWTSVISACEQNDHGCEARFYFKQMQQEGMMPNKYALVSVLAACAVDAALAIGKQVHASVCIDGLDLDMVVGATLVSMYGKCDRLFDAEMVFDRMPTRNVVAWTAMIEAYSQHGHGKSALSVFSQMQHSGVKPNQSTLVAVLAACADPTMQEEGKQLHAWLKAHGFQEDAVVGTALINMYARCGSLKDAEIIFIQLPKSDVVVWNSMIGAYALYEMIEKALELFNQMQNEFVKPNKVTYINILVACSTHATALQEGLQIHSCIIDAELHHVSAIGNTLIGTYSKCASLNDAQQVFDGILEKNVFSWSTLICAYANHGFGKQALYIFSQMQEDGVFPDKVTFIGVLVACNQAGLHDEAYKHFISMVPDHGILPISHHYTCMVDVLGKAGCLSDAEALLDSMPIQPAKVLFSAFLNACRYQACVRQGEHAALCWHELDTMNLIPYLMLGYIYTAAGWMDDTTAFVDGLTEKLGSNEEEGRK